MKNDNISYPDGVVDPAAYRSWYRLGGHTAFAHLVSSLMSERYSTYHWSMPLILLVELTLLLFIAVFPHWCGVFMAATAWFGFRWFNEGVATLVWRQSDRLQRIAYGWTHEQSILFPRTGYEKFRYVCGEIWYSFFS